MLKLLISILCIFLISLGLLRLRQERLNTQYEINRLHVQIETAQGTLWNQQVQIAGATTPKALGQQTLDTGNGDTGSDTNAWVKPKPTKLPPTP